MLLAAGDRKSAVRLLNVAFDSGIQHFDTARLYAEGLAEGVLGEAFSHRRDQVVLVSKAGILPTDRSLKRRVVDKAFHVARKVPPLGKILREPAVAEPTFGVFDVPRLRESVDKSLRQLRTDYLDALLLHECRAGNAADPEIKAFADDLVAQGKIRAYGVAPTVEEARAIDRLGVECGTIMQIASSACEEGPPDRWQRGGRLLVTHSVLGARFRDALEHLRRDREAAERWRAAFDMAPGDGRTLARLLLGHALHANPSGIVLFSTSDPARIRDNLQAAATPLSEDQARQFAMLLGDVRGGERAGQSQLAPSRS
jgi:D-threo-aldose 1-dehydrogenase